MLNVAADECEERLSETGHVWSVCSEQLATPCLSCRCCAASCFSLKHQHEWNYGCAARPRYATRCVVVVVVVAAVAWCDAAVCGVSCVSSCLCGS